MINKFDSLLDQLGTGRWNVITILLVGYWVAQVPSNSLGGTYLTPSVNHSCRIPDDGIPIYKEDKDNQTTIDACWYYKQMDDGKEKIPCTEWDFDNSTFLTTLTSEFQMVCERAYLRPTFQSMYFFGALIAGPICGFLSDSYGRKTVTSVAIILYSTLSNLIRWMPNVSSIFALRFIMGLMHPTTISVSYTLVMEQSAPKHRAAVGILTFLPFVLGYFTWAGQAYLIRDWRWLMVSVPIPSLLAIPLLWFIDESPRWLILKGRHDEAMKVLRRAARLNNAMLPSEEELVSLMKRIQSESSDYKRQMTQRETSLFMQALKTFVDETLILFRTPAMRRIILCIYSIFLVSGFVYYGLSLSGDSLGSDPFIYLILSGTMEIPGSTVTLPMINILGRKRSDIICYFGTGVSLLLLTVIPKGWVATAMVLVGKMAISAAYQVIYLHATELIPTEVRVRGLGTSSMVAKMGTIIVPYIINALGEIYWWGPSVVCGGMSMVACLICFMLPETLRKALPDTVAELEANARNRKRKEIVHTPEEMSLTTSDKKETLQA